MKGLIGKKIGMTQVWDKDGRRVAVTVLEVGPCPVIQVKTAEKDGYQAAQLGFGSQKPQRLTKSAVARYAKAGVPPCRVLHEFRLDAGDTVMVFGVFSTAFVVAALAAFTLPERKGVALEDT